MGIKLRLSRSSNRRTSRSSHLRTQQSSAQEDHDTFRVINFSLHEMIKSFQDLEISIGISAFSSPALFLVLIPFGLLKSFVFSDEKQGYLWLSWSEWVLPILFSLPDSSLKLPFVSTFGLLTWFSLPPSLILFYL